MNKNMSGSFDVNRLKEKFYALNSTQDSVQTLSLWILHHKAHCEKIIEIWLKVFKKSNSKQKLNMFYLANDVIQNSKKRNSRVFVSIYKRALIEAVFTIKDESIKPPIKRILSILKERKFYDKIFIDDLIEAINSTQEISPKVVFTKSPQSPPKQQSIQLTTSPALSDKIDNFKPKELFLKINKVDKLSKDLKNKEVDVEKCLSNFDLNNKEWVKQYKDKASGQRLDTSLENVSLKLESLITFLDSFNKDRKTLINNTQRASKYYETVNDDARFVTTAYKRYTKRIETVKSKLNDQKNKISTPTTITNNSVEPNNNETINILNSISRIVSSLKPDVDMRINDNLNNLPNSENIDKFSGNIKSGQDHNVKINLDTDLRLTSNKDMTASNIPMKGSSFDKTIDDKEAKDTKSYEIGENTRTDIDLRLLFGNSSPTKFGVNVASTSNQDIEIKTAKNLFQSILETLNETPKKNVWSDLNHSIQNPEKIAISNSEDMDIGYDEDIAQKGPAPRDQSTHIENLFKEDYGDFDLRNSSVIDNINLAFPTVTSTFDISSSAPKKENYSLFLPPPPPPPFNSFNSINDSYQSSNISFSQPNPFVIPIPTMASVDFNASMIIPKNVNKSIPLSTEEAMQSSPEIKPLDILTNLIGLNSTKTTTASNLENFNNSFHCEPQNTLEVQYTGSLNTGFNYNPHPNIQRKTHHQQSNNNVSSPSGVMGSKNYHATAPRCVYNPNLKVLIGQKKY
ncbi:regulation of nuclear pre-mRNA domain-containing protein 2-like isoform X2 [Gordionus sp. m RMFG-2023]|uniref:regulation of nuclear pre-mRNA domain-containing protein 2-like isoform X2 n=1 Tax=Gordionus sp. m RMFG-2023 TaxID=3053472 RepID=UPI0031FCDAFF